MAENKGVNNAQNAQLNQSDDAIHAHAQHDTFGVGTVDAPAIAPGNQMWFGTGNTPDNYNITNDVADGIQTAMKVHVRQGADIAPTKAGANGEQFYTAPSGSQPGNPERAAWNLDYDVNTASGVAPDDAAGLAAQPGLDAHDFKMQITQSGPQFLTPHTATFDLDAKTHQWVDEADPSRKFGGSDDFQPPKGASAEVMAHVAENSVNLGFGALQQEFGALPASTAAGTNYDVKLAGFRGDSPQMLTFAHDNITLAT
jgi:hypothetical protein